MTTRERPIIFTAESVRAILALAKTQTRRVIAARDVDRLDRRCPYGAPGSRWWVKETWARLWIYGDRPSDDDTTEYRADTGAARPGGWAGARDAPAGAGWCSPLYMPRALSRITLEVTAVRIERLQAITETDARAEGVTCRVAYARLWDSINRKRRPGCSWSENPWVWVISFRFSAPGPGRGV